MSGSSIVLVAHGSTDHANATIHDLAGDLASQIDADRVTAAFLNGQPLVTEVLEGLPPGRVQVVPIMTSQGYYLNKLPALLEENRNFEQFEVAVTPVVGTHPRLPQVMSQRLERHLQQHQLDPAQTTVVVIGHGTARNANSCQTTLSLLGRLQQINQHPELEFRPAFLDQQPALDQVVADLDRPHVVALPFLISPGPHLVEDVVGALGLQAGSFPVVGEQSAGPDSGQFRVSVCDCALVEYPEMRTMVLDLIVGVAV